MRQFARSIAGPAIARLLVPLKLFAWRMRPGLFRRLLLEVTSFFDWALVFAAVQNHAMLITQQAFGGGNFLFGKALMVGDHATTERDIALPTLRGNRFMGVDVVSNDPGAFVTNAGPITTAAPVRTLVRRYIDTEVMTGRVRAFDRESLAEACRGILDEWRSDPVMATGWSIRGAATRIFLAALAGQTLPKELTDSVTRQYAQRFAEFSLLGRYFPFLLGVVGTREGIRRDAFIPLRRYGIDNIVIDMTLFAAMFSVGTIVIRCVELIAGHRVDYPSLSPQRRMALVIEAQRLWPTVTTLHRIVEEPETAEVAGRTIHLGPGDEVAYPFICANRDARRFDAPLEFRLDRPREEMEAVLSWSKGAHVCPAKDLSIIATIVMLDELAARFDLRSLRIESPEF